MGRRRNKDGLYPRQMLLSTNDQADFSRRLGGLLPGMAQGQDVASPSMPNVDRYRQTPEFARERAAVARYMFFWTLCGRIAILESDIKGNVNAGRFASGC